VGRLDEVITNIEQYEWGTVFTKGPAYRVRLHPEVAVGSGQGIGLGSPGVAEKGVSGQPKWRHAH